MFISLVLILQKIKNKNYQIIMHNLDWFSVRFVYWEPYNFSMRKVFSLLFLVYMSKLISKVFFGYFRIPSAAFIFVIINELFESFSSTNARKIENFISIFRQYSSVEKKKNYKKKAKAKSTKVLTNNGSTIDLFWKQFRRSANVSSRIFCQECACEYKSFVSIWAA